MTFDLHHAPTQMTVPTKFGVRGAATDVRLRDFAERRLEYALGRFAARLRNIEVWLDDVNGPRRGVDKRCRIGVRLKPRGQVTVTAEAENEFAAVARAVKRIAAAFERLNKRRWMSRNRPTKSPVP